MSENVAGKKLVENLGKEIENTQEIIDILRNHVEMLKNPDYLQGVIKEDDRRNRIVSYEGAIDIDTKLIASMKNQLKELQK